MFQTDHAYSSFHAAARCLSGGPVYITDVPGKHDVSLIQQMTAKNSEGRSIILRPERIGRTSEIYVAHSEARLLRVQTSHQGASILGLFNVGSSSSREIISLAEFPDLVDGTSYIVRHYSSGRYSGPWFKQDEFPFVEVEIAERGFEILTAYPVHRCGAVDVAVLGLLGKMSGAAAILSLRYPEQEISSQVGISVRLKALGLLGTYSFIFSLANMVFSQSPNLNKFAGIYLPTERIDIDAITFSACGTTLRASQHLEVTRDMLVFDLSRVWVEFRQSVGDTSGSDKELEFYIILSLV